MDNKNRCWLDGSDCPYGAPEGRFDLRPKFFCQKGGCRKILDFGLALKNTISDISILSPTVEEWVSENKPTTISESLSCIIESEKDFFDNGEKDVIAKAAQILKKHGKESDGVDPEIYYASDL